MSSRPSSNSEHLDRLLARGRVSGPSRDRILAGVLRATHPPRRARRWVWGLPLCAGATAVLLLATPLRRDAFSPKGGTTSARIGLEVGCADGVPDRCSVGQRLVFRVEGAASGGFFAAWAERVDNAPAGDKIWYFPSRETGTVEVRHEVDAQVLRRAVILGPEQPPGRYRVHLFLLARSLTRDQILSAASGDIRAHSTVFVEVTP